VAEFNNARVTKKIAASNDRPAGSALLGEKCPRPFTKKFTRSVVRFQAQTWKYPKRPDIPPIPFQGLRHGYATKLLEAGIHAKIAQKRIGRSTLAVTLNLYRRVAKTVKMTRAGMVDKARRVAINERIN